MKHWIFERQTPMIDGMAPLAPSRHARGHSGWLAAAGLGLLSCGSTVSLNDAVPTSSSSSSTDASSTDAAGLDTTGLDTTAATTDLPTALPPVLPPGACPAACTLAVDEVWRWDAEPLEPGDPTEVRVTAASTALDGTVILAEMLDDDPWLRRIDGTGEQLWRQHADMSCACEIADLSPNPSGSMMVLGAGPSFGVTHRVVLGSLDVTGNGFEWLSWTAVLDPEHYRVGSVFSIDGIYSGALVVDRDLYGPVEGNEILQVLAYEFDFLIAREAIDSQPEILTDRPPVGAPGLENSVAVGFTDTSFGTPESYVVWLDQFFYPAAVDPLPGPPDAALPSFGAVLFGGLEPLGPDQPGVHALYVTQSQQDFGLDWTFEATVTAPEASPPALAVDEDGQVTVAVRTTGEAPEDAALWLWRLDLQGQLLWSTAVPFAPEPGPPPVFIESQGHDVLLITTLDGRAHVERLQPSCACR